MKQVNVLMDQELLNHLDSLSTMISLITNKKITVSDVVRKAVIGYSGYGEVKFENEFKDNKAQMKAVDVDDDSFVGKADNLINRIWNEKW